MGIHEGFSKVVKIFLDNIFVEEKEKISRYALRYALLVFISVLVFSLISILVPFSEESILWWISRTNDISGVLAYFGKFYIISLGIIIAPILLLIALFSLTTFAALILLRSKITLREVALIAFPSCLPFLILFWVPVVSWFMLVAVPVLVIYKFRKMFSLRKSVLACILGLILLLALLTAGFLSIYSVSNFGLAEPTKEGYLFVVGKTDENIFGIHGVIHDYEIFYDNTLAKIFLKYISRYPITIRSQSRK